ncbi:MAG: hypothetical protein RBR63_04545 [Methanosarcina vacuolata]|nr:hypothetical protein [Methanosarcina vacuolata]
MSEGYIGEIFGLMKEAASYAIRSGSEKITLKEIQECDYLTLKESNKKTDLKNI